MRHVVTSHPDQTFDPDDPKTPSILGKKLRYMYKIVPDKAAAFEAVDGTLGLLITSAGMDDLPPYAWSFSIKRFGQYQAFLDRDIAVPLYEHSDWKRIYEQKTGQGTPKLPYWYEKALRVNGRLPFSTGYDVLDALEKNGWKAQKIAHGLQAAKQFIGMWVSVSNYSGDSLYFSCRFPKGLGIDLWDDFKNDVSDTLPDLTKVTLAEIEQTATAVAAKAKAWKPKRKPTDVTGIWWNRLEGAEALKAWKAEVLRVILEIFSPRHSYHAQKGLKTQSVVMNVLQNYGLENLIGLTREQKAVQIRAALDKLAKEGKIEKDTNARDPLWWSKTSASRVAMKWLSEPR